MLTTLLVIPVTAALSALAVGFVLAAAVLAAGPHGRWWAVGATLAGLMLGLLLAGLSLLLSLGSPLAGALHIGTAVAQAVGLLCALMCGVLLMARPGGVRHRGVPAGTGLGVAAGALIGLGESIDAARMAAGLTGSLLGIGLGIVLRVVLALVLAAGLAALGHRWRAMAGGVGAGAAVGAALLLVGVVGLLLRELGEVHLGFHSMLLLPLVLVAFGVGAGITALTGRRSLDSTAS